MNAVRLYPLKFEPIFQYRIWGGRRLTSLLPVPLPGEDPVGEAWLLSDRADHTSIVAEGALKGKTIHELMQEYPEKLLGKAAGLYKRFPLLLKFLDAQTAPSVQVHPSDQHTKYLPDGESGKTEAWVILDTGPKSHVYAGLQPGCSPAKMKRFLDHRQIAELLSGFRPSVGEAVFIKPGTVHTMDDVVIFEIEQNSDVTFRLYDWDRTDKNTGKPRGLQVKQAMACTDFSQGAIGPVEPEIEIASPVMRERLFDCPQFILWRIQGDNPFKVGEKALPRVLVCIEGKGQLDDKGSLYVLNKGDVMLLPAVLNSCSFRPQGKVTLFEIALPKRA
jgi:mannose-6-phosphate isomerase